MNISEVVKKTGIKASTLRYYEEIGLIKSLGRKGLQRYFAADVIDQLALISLAKCADFSLQEISAMFAANEQPLVDRNKLLDKAAHIDETIKRLTLMSNCLKHAAVCKAPSHLECPSFRRLMKAAITGRLTGST
ncbi:helix-turn-helix domain-containing protein [Methylophilus sp. QUAN]|uniref:helix-turn-helix domain-containing protein n=1 Tax=Methylophilus sp. QUAN TaxID=2781020 RepID=UPI0018901177|nr:helix-turn-helix domain-containing protein [Methylophilus sp. QUAN]MBF4992319.1 helix-turn-helix domain-containing protein [Methylophilus sp. QUAN]